jgi:thiol:disulfide interchange protein DsbC
MIKLVGGFRFIGGVAPKSALKGGLAASLRMLSLSVLLISTTALVTPAPAQAQGTASKQPAPSRDSKDSPESQAAPASVAAAVRSAVDSFTKGRYKVDEVRRTPLAGIYEARIGKDLIYVDEKGQYLLYQGDLIDMKTQRNLTQERVEDLMAIRFEDLPLKLAIRQEKGDGKNKIAVFEDPNCGFCKRLRADLIKLDNVTIYTFPLAFLAADSESKARKALCANDQGKAWDELLVQSRIPDTRGTCDTSIEKVRELSHKLGITGTPVVFFANGKRLQGYAPPERFNQMLAEYSKG